MHNFSRFLLSIAVLLVYVQARPAHAQAPTFDRAITCTNSPDSYGWGPKRIAVDGQGNTIAAGLFNGTVVLGTTVLTAAGTGGGPTNPAPPDVFVTKLDAAGTYVWAAKASGTLWEDVAGVAVDAAGDVYVTGYFESFNVAFGSITLFNSSAASEVFVAKLSGTTGQWLWAKRCGGTNHDKSSAIAVSASGEIYVTGYSGSAIADFGPQTLTASQYGYVFIAKLSSAGTWLWAQQTATGGFPTLSGMVLDGQGNIYIAGTFSDGSSGGRSRSLSFGTTTLTTYTPGTQGNYPSTSGSDLFVAKFTDAGTPLWAVQGDPNGQNIASASDLGIDGLGHLYVVGSYSWLSARIGGITLPNQSNVNNGPQAPIGQMNYRDDAWAARLNTTTGTWEWVIRAGGTQGDGITAIMVDGQNKPYVAGDFDNPLPGGGRVQIAQLEGATGAWRWTLPLVGSVLGLTLDGANRLILGGYFPGPTATFGTFTLFQASGLTGTTGYLARLGTGPLAAYPTAVQQPTLMVWPNPTRNSTVWVQGLASGSPVQVFDALGRMVATGRMPISGPLRLALPATISAGLYVVRSAGQARQVVVE